MSSETLYDIVLTGKLEPGCSPAEARFQLADLFKVEPERIAAILTAAPQVVRKGIDEATALRYVEAIRRCGAQALAEAREPAQPAPAAHAPAAEPAAPAHAAPAPAWSLSAPGADLLRPDERLAHAPREVDTRHLSLAALEAVAAPRRDAPPPPDTRHLSLAEAGEDLLVVKPLVKRARIGDLSHLEVLPAGSELLSADERPAQQAIAPDTSHLRLE